MKIQSSTVIHSSPTHYNYYYTDGTVTGSAFSLMVNSNGGRDAVFNSHPNSSADEQDGTGHGVDVNKASQYSFSWSEGEVILMTFDHTGYHGVNAMGDIPPETIAEMDARTRADDAARITHWHFVVPRESTSKEPEPASAKTPEPASDKAPEPAPPQRELSEVITTETFISRGKVTTEDGRHLNFNFYMATPKSSDSPLISNSYRTMGQAPLILELNGEVPELSDDTMGFDIDNDGVAENIRLLGPGSGFLALDKNKDGVVNDGSELFIGGFNDLRRYDSDRNGWIDENDEIFNDLRVWENTEEGDMRLVSLKEAGLGAIYLKDSVNNVDLWETRSGKQDTIMTSSVVLDEGGRVSGIHALDLNGLNPRNIVDES